MSDVFAAALEKWDEVGTWDSQRQQAWVIRVAKNTCNRHHRGGFRGRALHRRLAAAFTEIHDPITKLFEADTRPVPDYAAQIAEVMAVLSPKTRKVLELDAQRTLSQRQMAAAMEITYAALRLRLMRARRAFAAEYEQRFGTPRFKDGGQL